MSLHRHSDHYSTADHHNTNTRQRHLLLILISCIIALGTSSAGGQTLNPQQLKASYIYNIIQNITWPNESHFNTFNIAIYSENNPALIKEINALTRVKRHGTEITVKRLRNLSSLDNVHLLYIDKANDRMINRVYAKIGTQPTLIVTSGYDNKRLVMINLFQSNNNILFEVNKANILNQRLKPLPSLILNGGTEIDVATLYKEGQKSLIRLQKQLQSKEITLKKLSHNIAEQQQENALLTASLQEIKTNIEKSNHIIDNQEKEIALQQKEITQSKQERTKLLIEVKQRNEELNRQEKRLAKRKKDLDIISNNIIKKEKEVTNLNTIIQKQKGSIATQEEKIHQQQRHINSLGERVDSQQATLNFLWLTVTLGTLLLGAIFYAYLNNRRYNKTLREQTHQLQIARDRLSIAKTKADTANQAKSDFLSVMSHELRSPLQAIIGYTDITIEELHAQDNKQHTEDLNRVISNAHRLLLLINRILDLTKIESGKMDITLHPMNLSSIVDEAVSTIYPLLSKNGNTLIKEIDDGNSPAEIDHDKILHILINLLTNATKFTQNGTITIQAIRQPEAVHIEVKDSGIGLSPEEKRQVFERFHQADAGTTRKFQGSGLGLSITKQFCELMGGTIKVHSQKGKGTTFILHFPLPMVKTMTKEEDEAFIAMAI